MSVPASQSGFTLAEALVAIAVTALMAVAIAPMLMGASRLSARIEHDLARLEAMRTDAELLRVTAGSSLRPPPELDAEFGLRGGPDRISFIADPPDTDGPVRFIFDVEATHLSLAIESVHEDLVRNARLLEGWSDIAFEFWGAETSIDPPITSTTWTSSKPPRLWTITGVFAGEERRIDIPLGSDVVIACRYDPVIRRCRGTP